MADRDKSSAPDHDRMAEPGSRDDSIIPGRHGKHGGGLESEGSPQEQSPESSDSVEQSSDKGDKR